MSAGPWKPSYGRPAASDIACGKRPAISLRKFIDLATGSETDTCNASRASSTPVLPAVARPRTLRPQVDGDWSNVTDSAIRGIPAVIPRGFAVPAGYAGTDRVSKRRYEEDAMPLDPQVQAMRDNRIRATTSPLYTLSVEQARV